MAKNYLTVQPDRVALLGRNFTQGRGGRKIRYITRHHTAGVLDADAINRVWASRPASAHYLVDPKGIVSQHVWDAATAWSNANSVSNQESLTIEHSNSAGAGQDWPINDITVKEGARWAAALCLFYGLGKPEFGRNIRDHREFSATSCPYHLAKGGKYHQTWMDEARRFYDVLAAAKAGNVTAPKPPAPEKQEETPAMPDHDRVPSLINPDVKLTLQHYRQLQDAYAWENRAALRGLYDALGLDYDATITAAIEADLSK